MQRGLTSSRWKELHVEDLVIHVLGSFMALIQEAGFCEVEGAWGERKRKQTFLESHPSWCCSIHLFCILIVPLTTRSTVSCLFMGGVQSKQKISLAGHKSLR